MMPANSISLVLLLAVGGHHASLTRSDMFLGMEREYGTVGKTTVATMLFLAFTVHEIATGSMTGILDNPQAVLVGKLCLYRTHGITKDPALLHEHHGGWYYEMQELGYNYRLTDFQAALGISQLERAKAGLERRHEIVRRYNEAFSGIDGIKTPFNAADVYHAYHLYIIQVADRLGL